jgi:Zn-dependent protease
MPNTIPILRLAGIRINAHWSVLLVAGLLAWGIAGGVIPAAVPGTSPPVSWGIGVAAAVLLIASLTAHELAHTITAKRRGVAGDDITLWVFGGVSHMHDDWKTPGTELLVAAAGPAATVLVAGVFLGLTYLFAVSDAPRLAQVLVQWLLGVNVLLLVFNLVPAFPLDGGRILRALLWKLRGDRRSATIAAARGGRVFAMMVIALGAADFFLTADLGGLWLVFVGWFLDTAARREQQGEFVRDVLAGVRVRDAMTPNPMSIPSWLTVDVLFEQYVMRTEFTSFPTHGINGDIDGLVTLRDIRRVAPHQRSSKRVADIAVPLERVPRAAPGDLLVDLLPRLTAETDSRALVFEEGALTGIVSPRDIARVLAAIAPNRRSWTRPAMPPPVPPSAASAEDAPAKTA